MDFLWLDLMGDSLHHWQPMLKESPFSSQMILTFIRTDPSSSQTPAKDTTECKPLLLIYYTSFEYIHALIIVFNGLLLFTRYLLLVCSAHFFILLEGEATGRLLRYDPPTKTTHVVLDVLVFPNGVQFSKDHSFLLYTETTNCR